MLVLTRGIQEKIQIGDNITVTILRMKGRMISIGIDAPKNIRVMRSELVGAVKEVEAALAAKPKPSGESAANAPAAPLPSSDRMAKQDEPVLHDAAEPLMELAAQNSNRVAKLAVNKMELPEKTNDSLRIARRFRIVVPNSSSSVESN